MNSFGDQFKCIVKSLNYKMSRVLFIVLIGCAIAFCSPVKREAEGNNEVSKPTQQEVEEAVKNVLKKIGEAIKEILRTLFNRIQQGFNSEEIKNAVQNLKVVLEKAFNESSQGQNPNGQEIQSAVNNVVKKVCEAYKDFLTSFLQKIEEQIKDGGLKNSIKQLKELLERIFNYKPTETNFRNLGQGLTNDDFEHIDNGFQEIFKHVLEAILKQFGDQLTEEEKQDLKEALQGMQEAFDFQINP